MNMNDVFMLSVGFVGTTFVVMIFRLLAALIRWLDRH